MSSSENDEISSKRNNNSDLNRLEKQSVNSSDEIHKEIYKKLKWYENPVLQTSNSNQAKTTTYSSFYSSLYTGLLIVAFLPIILIAFVLFLLLWILPGLGWFYERYAEARDRKKYYPPIDEMKPWGPDNKLIHVVHLRAPESKLPPIVYVSGMGLSMYFVKPLLLKFVEYMDEPVEIISFDPLGYGASEPPNDWNTENAESQRLLLRQVIAKSTLRKPFILFGASAGGLLAHLYCLTYPEDVAGIILTDPTPSTIFEQGSPIGKVLNRACIQCGIMARAASWGLLRPLSFLLHHFSTGDVGDIFRYSHPGYIALLMTHTMLQKLASQLRYLHTIPDCISKQLHDDATSHRNIPLLVLSALNWTKKRPYGGFTREEMSQWWSESHQFFVRNSDNAGFIPRTDYTHMQCIVDMELVANATKAVLTQIHSEIVH
ncbi:unnamed protein product [Rotaria sp. Silwood1]|nr:unnamed protein product [Rotaria sp. Silwood1]CAF4829664.1 unnamed protein product [Rotaria sp. Silwood1]CAF4953165.1 unnamed protein product [Rotaria sp. Silwood1]